MSSIALTDTNNLSGAIEFYSTAVKEGIKPILGVELKNGSERAVLLAKNNNGYKEVCDTVTTVLQAIPQVKPKLTLENLIEKQPSSNEEEKAKSLIPFLSLLTDDVFILSSTPGILRALAPGRKEQLYMELIPAERKRWKFLREIYRDHKLQCIASNNVFLHTDEDHAMHALLRAIGTNTTLGNTPGYELADKSQYFSREDDIQKLFYDVDANIFANNQRIADQCEVSFTLEKNKFARFPHEDPERLLRELTREGLTQRGKLQSVEYLARIENELNIISSRGATSYFLAVHDMLQFAKRKNFPFLGRGSGANSLVAYLLGIANVDPVVNNLRFERFLNPERESAPDFDIDFSWRDRYEVINYMLDKYGRENAAMLCTVQSYRNKGTMREVGKALGYTDAEINERISGEGLIRNTAGKGQSSNKEVKQVETDKQLPDVNQWHELAKKIYGFPRNLSVHAGGIVIGDKALSHYTPVQYAPIGVPITQLDMFSAEDLGLIKLDILSTRGLGTYWDTMNLVEKRYGVRPPVTDETVAFNDEATKASIREGRTKGCFYIESPAMISLLRKLRTDTFENLTAASSVIRPGVSQSGMMQEFIRRHRGQAPAIHIHPLLGELMKDTYGVMVYQEDVLIVAHELAGLSYGEADLFRRAMSGKLRSHERMHEMQGKFVKGCVSRGVEPAVAEEVWRQVASFAGYSFCKAHSASYAVLSFQEAWLKVHYPAEFICSVLNNFGGFYNHQEYIEEAKRLEIIVRLPDVNKSEQLHTVEEDGSIRLGLVAFKEVTDASLQNILLNRQAGNYASIEDFARRSGVTYEDGLILIQVGFCDSLSSSRMEAALLFGLMTRPSMVTKGKKRSAGQSSFPFEEEHLAYELPEYSSPKALALFQREKQYLGYSVTNSPFDFIVADDDSITPSRMLSQFIGGTVTVAGYVSATKVTSTRKGDRMLMLNISDADGMIDVVVWPDVFRKAYSILSTSHFLKIKGKISESFDVVGLEAISISEYQLPEAESRIVRRKPRPKAA